MQPLYAATLNVPAPYPDIQAGIDAAINGDTVLVADSTYTGPGNRDIDFGGKLIVVKSENGPEETIIDCQGSDVDHHRAFKFINGEDSTAIVAGFSIINGFGPMEYGTRKGGAVYCYASSPTISNCVFDNNLGYDNGGAIATFASSPIFIDCEFKNNFTIHGGAIYFNGLVPFKDMDAPAPRLLNCVFHDNSARVNDGYGGAIYAQYGNMEVTITGCVFYNNQAFFGGGAGVVEDCLLRLSNSTFFGNEADEGGGLAVGDGIVAWMNGCILAYNRGGGAIAIGSFTFISDLSCSDIFGNVGDDWGPGISAYYDEYGNISLDPGFCDTT